MSFDQDLTKSVGEGRASLESTNFCKTLFFDEDFCEWARAFRIEEANDDVAGGHRSKGDFGVVVGDLKIDQISGRIGDEFFGFELINGHVCLHIERDWFTCGGQLASKEQKKGKKKIAYQECTRREGYLR